MLLDHVNVMWKNWVKDGNPISIQECGPAEPPIFPRTWSVLRGLESSNHHSRTSFSCSLQKQEKLSANPWFSPSSSSKGFRAVDMVIKSLEVTVMSAKDLPNVNVIHKMDPYVIVSLSGNHKQRTHVHKNGGTSPRWVKLLTFPVDEARADLLILMFEIMTEKTYGGDKEVGKVEVPIAELLEKQGDGKPKQISYSVSLPSGKTQGVLEFNYKFGEELPGGCGNTPAPEQGPTKKSGGQGWIGGLAGGLAVGLASGLVDGSASALAGKLTDGLFGTAQPEAAVDEPEAAVDGPEAATNGSEVAEDK
ncbi:hypothetical protein EUGRSUZ_G02880 [Eucalyptus grandis]|uniref:Uncharacterized protein n=2 Tax=Eucalyptus grandis TaxID=71139 RepID=A0ACC3K6X9_EUCGR|nr:hypothetical protein EUGRSUZ_G02880 [Eucalyptus grandis]